MSFSAPKPYFDKRPWGDELWITDKQPVMVKILNVNSGEAFSLQYHNDRDEYWRVLSGNGIAEIDGKKTEVGPGDEIVAPRGAQHRLTGGSERLTVLELAFGRFDENDIVRLEDRYGRI